MVNCKDALEHVRKCRECQRELRQVPAAAATEKKIELLVETDGCLPFSY